MILIIIILIIILIILIIFFYYKYGYQKNKSRIRYKYFLAVGAIFKNESHILKEWLDHNLKEGVDHFYLVDDSSTDNCDDIIKPYIKKGLVTLYKLPTQIPNDTTKQLYAYNTLILPLAQKETKWLSTIDLDEFITTRDNKTVRYKLEHNFKHATCIIIPWILFGSNNKKLQPSSVIKGFTKRLNYDKIVYTCQDRITFLNPTLYKSIFRPQNYNVVYNHKPDPYFIAPVLQNYFYSNGQRTLCPVNIWLTEDTLNDYHIVINHYQVQSEQFWKEVKCNRGDAMNYRERKMNEFNELNKNLNSVNSYNLKNKN